MALVTTTFSVGNGGVLMERFPYTGAGDMQKMQTGIPRSEVNFLMTSGFIAASAVGDNQRFIINCDLPSSYAYVLQEVSLSNLVGVDGANWDPNTITTIRTINIDQSEWRHSLDFFSRGDTWDGIAGSVSKSYHMSFINPLKRLIIPGQSATLQIHVTNETEEQSSMLIAGFFARFLEFDVNQAHFYAANTPDPTR